MRNREREKGSRRIDRMNARWLLLSFILYVRFSLSDGRWRAVVDFLKCPVKKFLIGKSVRFDNLTYGCVPVLQLLVNMRDSDFIDILKKRKAHMFFEEAAEIFFIISQEVRTVLKRQRRFEMIVYIGNDLLQPLARVHIGGRQSGGGMDRKIPYQMCQNLENDTFRFQMRGRNLLNRKACQLHSHLTDIRETGHL